MEDYKAGKQVIAAFDFDGTITTRDSLVPFLFYTGGVLKTLKSLAFLVPIFIKYITGYKSRQATKESILKKSFGKMSLATLESLGESFAASPQLDNLIRPEAKQRIQWHLKQGHRCIIVSASVGIYLKPWAKLSGFHDVISSRLKITKEGIVTGELEGLNCWGPEKTRRLNELAGPRNGYILYAYGDSLGDKELLSEADCAYYKKFC